MSARRLAALCLVLLLFVALPAAAQEALRFVGGNWYDGEKFVAREFYAVDGVLQDSWNGSATVVGLDGAWVVPGYGNAHTHGVGGGNPSQESDHFLGLGVFYAANPNNVGSHVKAVREAFASPENVDATFANGGLTSSGGHPIQIFELEAGASKMAGSAYFAIDDQASLKEQWPDILEGEPDFLKIYLESAEFHDERKNDPAFYGKRGLDPELLPEIVARAHAANLRVAAHVTSRFDFRTAVEAGVDEIAHLPLATLQADDAELAASKGTVLVTTALSHRPYDGDGDLDEIHRENLMRLKKAGVRMVLGTDSQASVIDEVHKLESLGAYTRAELLRMLVTDTPRWIFPDRNIGMLQAGAEANLVVLESNPLEDLAALRQIDARFKAGHRIEIESAESDELPGIGQQLVHTLMARGTDTAIAEYHRLRTEEPEAWDFSEGQLNALGYAMIQHGKVTEAVAIFQLNTEQYPESANVWDSLGEAWAKQGDTAKAIESYERALELRPDLQTAKDALEKLRSTGSGR